MDCNYCKVKFLKNLSLRETNKYNNESTLPPNKLQICRNMSISVLFELWCGLKLSSSSSGKAGGQRLERLHWYAAAWLHCHTHTDRTQKVHWQKSFAPRSLFLSHKVTCWVHVLKHTQIPSVSAAAIGRNSAHSSVGKRRYINMHCD